MPYSEFSRAERVHQLPVFSLKKMRKKISRNAKEVKVRFYDHTFLFYFLLCFFFLMLLSFAGLFPEIRRKLAAVLVHWNPSDPSAHVMLSPWKDVFDPRSMEALLEKCIAPKLAAGLRASLVINPADQVLDSVRVS